MMTVPSPGLAVNGNREMGGFLFFSESYGGMFVCQGDVQQWGKAGDAEARRVPVMRYPSPPTPKRDPAHSVTVE